MSRPLVAEDGALRPSPSTVPSSNTSSCELPPDEAPAEAASGHVAHHGRGKTLSLALAALGVVYGDIGTSPLYAVKECFHGPHAAPVTQENVHGVLSLIFWALTVVVGVKYVLCVMRADNKGEGGIFALLALYEGGGRAGFKKAGPFLGVMAIFGAALLYGDGVITPAISVLSAVEGLSIASEALASWVVPLTCLILFGLFFFQKHGTAAIGRIFGPIMILWFVCLSVLGLVEILDQPHILAALNPVNAVLFFQRNGLHGMVVLGAVVLCITGGEALYADMGHFGLGPIRLSWYGLVFPSLLLNYFGQGALLLDHPDMAFNPFYGLVPPSLLYPMTALSTAATVIASQAMISGVYSLTQQAIQLGFSPRMRIAHTSETTMGQIYLPGVNWGLMLACVGLTLVFRESSRLAAAYGIAVTMTMAITSVLYYAVTRRVWGWSTAKALPLLVLFLAFDLAFLGANLLKIFDGGWITVLIAAFVAVGMTAWRDGRAALGRLHRASRVPEGVFLADVAKTRPRRNPGTAVFMAVSPDGVPATLLHHYKHIGALPARVLFLSVVSTETPRVEPGERLNLRELGQGFFRLTAAYGFMETPSVPEIMALAGDQGLPVDVASTSFFLGRETLLTSGPAPMARWRKVLFSFMTRNAWNATSFFGIPPGRVVEFGAQVEL